MKAQLTSNGIRANCPDCNGSITTFEFRQNNMEFGSILVNVVHRYGEFQYNRILYKLAKCAGCGRGGIAKIHDSGNGADQLQEFHPTSIENLSIPIAVPEGISSEFREAELCASISAWRAASAMIRSTLEKVLKVNGYTTGNLESKINQANNDGIITDARKKKVHEDIRVLGNNVLHDEWRSVDQDEFELAHKYTQRILEDFYDDRETVKQILIAKNRIQDIKDNQQEETTL